MPYKSTNYYLKTILLKLYGFISEWVPGIDDYPKIKPDTVKICDRKRLNKLDLFYHTFSYFHHPNDLAQHLKMKDGIAQHRIESKLDHCSPFYPSYYGLVCFNSYLKTGEELFLLDAKAQLDTLLKLGTETEDQFILYYNIPLPKFLLKGRWYAGITQATMLSLALRRNQQNPDERLELVIHKLVKSMMVPGAEGGILINTPEGLPWIEEYPGAKPSYVLNGYIFCIISLLEYEVLYPNIQISHFIDRLLDSLVRSFPYYQRGKYLKYSRLYPTLSNIEYQGLYIGQFKHLYLLTGLEIFSQLAELYNSRISWVAFNEFFQITSPALQNKPA